jgi:hypothetical protein
LTIPSASRANTMIRRPDSTTTTSDITILKLEDT